MRDEHIRRRVDALADELARTGELTDPRWRQAMQAAPRHLFVPDIAWATPYNAAGHRIDRHATPGAWLAAAYANHPIIIQIGDGAVDVGTGAGPYTSSLSAPGVVTEFLELLDPYDGDQVLEIGTGSGWTSGLLSARLGDRCVTSVEIDAAVAEQAAARLKEAGFGPHLVVGDGAAGFPDGAPYDRVHVTVGVTSIPYAWVEQTRPGGLIVLPWMPEHAGGHKTVLTVLGDGRAVGRFDGGCGFMMLRAQRSSRTEPEGGWSDWRQSVGALDPRRVMRAAWGADVAIAGMLPDVSSLEEEGEDGTFTVRLWTADSYATVVYSPGRERVEVAQRGPRDLWEEVGAAFFRWLSWGQPGRDRFGMTVDAEGQAVWLDSPERVIEPFRA